MKKMPPGFSDPSPCCFCEGHDLKKFSIHYSPLQKNNIIYYICKTCGSIHQSPIPDQHQIEEYYSQYIKIKKDINPGYLDEKNKQSFYNERAKTLKEIRFDLNRIRHTHNVEVGCANGHFLEFLQLHGAEKITGIDISHELLSKIPLNNIHLIKGDLSDIQDNDIDQLYLFNIIEHMKDIPHFFSLISKKMKPNGLIIIEVPLAGLIARYFKQNWRFLMQDEHLHIPSGKGLWILLKKHDLKIVRQIRFGSGNTKGSIPGTLKNILDFCAKHFAYGDRGTFLVSISQNNKQLS